MEGYLGEIRLFSGNFAPQGWSLCDGKTLTVRDHAALVSIIGNTYGGDGMNTFSLPKIAPLSESGPNYIICVDGIYPVRD